MAKKNLGANRLISGYGPARWTAGGFKSLGIAASYGSYSASISRFISLNHRGFDYLGLQVYGEEEFSSDIRLERSRYCGVVPLFSADSGKAVGDLSVCGAYGEDIADIVSAIDGKVTVEFDPGLILTGNSSLTPPVYLECLRYIELFGEAAKARWTRFEVVNRQENRLRGMTDWNRYAARSLTDPGSALSFPNRFNALTTAHPEWLNLSAILKYAVQTATAPSVPAAARLRVSTKLRRLQPFVSGAGQARPEIPAIHASDPVPVKKLKESGRLIMGCKSAWQCAWRVDQALLFEEYVQYLCESALKSLGAGLSRNPRVGISGYRAPWTLSSLEPDAVAHLGSTTCIIDAKYKSHMYNGGAGEQGALDDSFRHDLHQVLAYSAFMPQGRHSRCAMLIYPASHFKVYRQAFHSGILSQTDIRLHLVGLPFNSSAINENVGQLRQLFRTMI